MPIIIRKGKRGTSVTVRIYFNGDIYDERVTPKHAPAKTRKELDAFVAKAKKRETTLKAELIRGVYQDPNDVPLLAEALDEFERFIELSGFRITTKHLHAWCLERFESYLKLKARHVTRIEQIDAEFLVAFVAWLQDEGGMKESSAATVMNTVSRMIRRWLVKGWLRKDPFLDDDFRSRRPKFTHRKRILSDEDFDAIVGWLREHSHGDVADLSEVLRFTGLRLSEANALRVCDVDFEGREIRIVANGDFRPKTPSSARIVPVPASVVALLRERAVRLGKRDEERLFGFNRLATHSPHVPIRQFRDAAKALGIYIQDGERIGLHNLRHTRCTELYNSPSVGLFSAMEVFEHVRTDTAKGYVHAASKEKHDAIAAVEAERERRRQKKAKEG